MPKFIGIIDANALRDEYILYDYSNVQLSDDEINTIKNKYENAPTISEINTFKNKNIISGFRNFAEYEKYNPNAKLEYYKIVSKKLKDAKNNYTIYYSGLNLTRVNEEETPE